MTLKIYNTLTRRKEEFRPLVAGQVRMYICGITAYDECHLGHARAAVVFDVIYRYLKLKYQVTYVRNFTDIDDKIIKKSLEMGLTCTQVSEKYIQSYREQMTRLGVEAPTQEPKATEHMAPMIALIQKLIDQGLAYPSSLDVFFEVRKFKGYGKLSNKKIDDLESGARVDVDEKKKDPLDFALWKGAKPNEPFWDSPWGKGRPGWHIECSAMSMEYLGENFDIHGGGRDLMFPHHENEIAQSEAATGHAPFARYWIHNGFVNINAEKMSKSLGNFRSIPAILEKWDPEVVRYFLLSAHYASPIDFTDESMANAQEALSRFYETLRRLQEAPAGEGCLSLDVYQILEKGMDDDFNTTIVIGELFRYIRQINNLLDRHRGWQAANREEILQGIKTAIGGVLGLFGSEPSEFLKKLKQKGLEKSSLREDEIKSLIEERKAARLAKNFKRADEIRQELEARGVVLKDNPDGSTTWTVKR